MVSRGDERQGAFSFGLHIGYGLNVGGFAFPLNGVPQGDLHFA